MTGLGLDWLAYDCGVQLICNENYVEHEVTMDVIGKKKNVRDFIKAAEARRPISFNFYYNEKHTGLLAGLNHMFEQIQLKFERR